MDNIKNDIHKGIKMIKERYTPEELQRINQKNLNYFLKKKYRYEKLGMKEKVEECDAYISLYHGCYFDFMDYVRKKEKQAKQKSFERLAYLLLIIKQEKDYLNIQKENKMLQELSKKDLLDLTEEEASLLGEEILKEYKDHEDMLRYFICHNVHKPQIIEYETLRDLTNICKKYLPKKK